RQAAREGVVRWLDRSHARPLAVGPIRAHGGCHGGGLRNLHAVARGPRPAGASILSFPCEGDAVMADKDDERGFFAERSVIAPARVAPAGASGADKPHYHGHRQRLRDRFREQGGAALADYELLELLLFRTIPRADTKAAAKALL